MILISRLLVKKGELSVGLKTFSLTTEGVRVMVGVFNATSNNISVLSWRSVLLVEETELPGENHPHAANH